MRQPTFRKKPRERATSGCPRCALGALGGLVGRNLGRDERHHVDSRVREVKQPCRRGTLLGATSRAAHCGARRGAAASARATTQGGAAARGCEVTGSLTENASVSDARLGGEHGERRKDVFGAGLDLDRRVLRDALPRR